MTVTDARATVPARASVADAMVTDAKISPAGVTVGALRALFANPKVHAAVLVDDEGRLAAVVVRADLDGAPAEAPAAPYGGLGPDRVVAPDADLDTTWERLLTSGGRRLAVAGDDGRFLGLLCLKRHRTGFCSDRDVRARARERAHRA